MTERENVVFLVEVGRRKKRTNDEDKKGRKKRRSETKQHKAQDEYFLQNLFWLINYGRSVGRAISESSSHVWITHVFPFKNYK